MTDKTLQRLKSNWPIIKKQGGFFAIAMNGFPKNVEALPLVRLHKKKPIDRKHLAKLDPKADLKKVIVGRVSLEHNKLVFNIDLESKVKSPSLLRKACRRLAKEPDLKKIGLGLMAKARCQMIKTVATEPQLDTADEARTRGQKTRKSLVFKGRFEKLVDKIAEWHAGYATLDSTNFDAAEALLDKIEARANEWIEENSQRTDKLERRKEVRHILQQIHQAREQIHAFEAELDREAALDDELDEILENPSKLEGSFSDKKGKLRAFQERLQQQLSETDDESERAELEAELAALGEIIASTRRAALQEPRDLFERDPRATPDEQLRQLQKAARKDPEWFSPIATAIEAEVAFRESRARQHEQLRVAVGGARERLRTIREVLASPLNDASDYPSREGLIAELRTLRSSLAADRDALREML